MSKALASTSKGLSSQPPDVLRLWLTFWIAVIGIVAALIALAFTVIVLRLVTNPGQTIPSIIGGVVTLIGTLGGLIAGHTAGSAGKESAEERANSAEQRLNAVLDVVPPGTLSQAQAKHPGVFTQRSSAGVPVP